MTAFKYKPDGAVLKAFLKDADPQTGQPHFVRGLRGPVGSGKSAGCCVEIFRRALAQKPGPDGIRHSRWAIIRNSYPELRTTTLQTWLQWFPEEVWGPVTMHPPPFTHVLKKGDLHLEVWFLALDRPEDVKKLLSLELTGIWANEARELAKAIIDACTMRVGRFPSMKDGGPTWYGVIMDTNAPDEDHWWPIMAGDVAPPEHLSLEDRRSLIKPASWKFYDQPGAMLPEKDAEGNVVGWELNPDRENQANMTADYYPRITEGKSVDWISVYVGNQIGGIFDGKAVYPDFRKSTHAPAAPVSPVANVPLIVGLDFGLSPAAVVVQSLRRRMFVLRELLGTDTPTTAFGPILRQFLAEHFPDWPLSKILFWGDPTGDHRAGTDATTPYQIMRAHGINVRPAPTNDPQVRIESVTQVLTRMVDGTPAMLVDPSCSGIIRGFEGGYHYRRLQVSGSERYESEPNKNKYSHAHDALQYAALGAGEGRTLLGRSGQARQVVAHQPRDPLARLNATGPKRDRLGPRA